MILAIPPLSPNYLLYQNWRILSIHIERSNVVWWFMHANSTYLLIISVSPVPEQIMISAGCDTSASFLAPSRAPENSQSTFGLSFIFVFQISLASGCKLCWFVCQILGCFLFRMSGCPPSFCCINIFYCESMILQCPHRVVFGLIQDLGSDANWSKT